MSNAKPTPGPWEVHFSHDITGYPIFYIHGFEGHAKRDDDTLSANAHLIAAAPDLLEALCGLVDAFDSASPDCGKELDRARAAIAKAQGVR